MASAPALRMLVSTSALLGSLLTTASARATYSIIALDVESGQLGGVGTSCVGSLSVYTIYGVVPGRGVVAAQASINMEARDRAVLLLEQGMSAADVIADISSESFDVFASVRQYAVIDLGSASTAGFTGAGTMAYAEDVQGSVAPYVYSVQGNILTSSAVLSQAGAVFAAPGCDLADTLMLALEAGAQNNQGDSRCTPDGIPSDGAFIEVNLAEQGTSEPFLHLQVDDTAPSNPVFSLRAMYDGWRAEHPCPEPQANLDAGVTPDAGAAPDAGQQDAGDIGIPVQPPAAGNVAPPLGSGGAGAGGASGMDTAGVAASEGAAPAPAPSMPAAQSSSSGCSIAHGARPALFDTWLLTLTAMLARSRLRRRTRAPSS